MKLRMIKNIINYGLSYIDCEINRKNKNKVSQHEIDQFLSHPDNPQLISFPRTGSHFVRVFLEKYIKRPTLPVSIDKHGINDYFLYHTHGMDTWRNNCHNYIYLYREPVDTIFSYTKYQGVPLNNRLEIILRANLYIHHLGKYMLHDNNNIKYISIRYENLIERPIDSFAKILDYLNVRIDDEKIEYYVNLLDKSETKKQLSNLYSQDKSGLIINTKREYSEERKAFRQQYSRLIYDLIDYMSSKLFNDKKRLINLFE